MRLERLLTKGFYSFPDFSEVFIIITKKRGHKPLLRFVTPRFLVGRAGIGPATNGLKDGNP